MGGVDGRCCSGLGLAAGLLWSELNTKEETGRESRKMDIGEWPREAAPPGRSRWSIWSILPGREAVCKRSKDGTVD